MNVDYERKKKLGKGNLSGDFYITFILKFLDVFAVKLVFNDLM